MTDESNLPESNLPESNLREYVPQWTFGDRLRAATPHVFVTHILIGINIAVYLAMLVKGVNWMSPTTDDLLRWGADYGALTVTGGQWWRTVTSMFLHIGLLHIGFNMFVLWQIGPFVERLVGNAGFFIAYMISGLGGAAASLMWSPYVVSAGASGAIFGVYGVLLGFLLVNRDESIPRPLLASLTKSALIFLGYNLVYGLVQSGIDLAAHGGGLVTGFLCGMGLSQPLRRSLGLRLVKNTIVGVVGCAALLGMSRVLPRPIDLMAETDRFATLEEKTLTAYNNVLKDSSKQKLGDDQLADELEAALKPYLPQWSELQDHLGKLTGLPASQQKMVGSLAQYMKLREHGWSLMEQGLRSHDVMVVRQGLAEEKQADAMAGKMGSQ